MSTALSRPMSRRAALAAFLLAVPVSAVGMPASAQTPVQPAIPGGKAANTLVSKVAVTEATRWFSVGRGAPRILYMYADSQCEHCKKAWTALMPYVSSGQIELRVIPVAVFGQESLRQAAMVLDYGDPAAAWARLHDGDKGSGATGVSDAAMRDVRNNMAAFYATGGKGTPHFVFRDFRGYERAATGLPTDLGSFLGWVGR